MNHHTGGSENVSRIMKGNRRGSTPSTDPFTIERERTLKWTVSPHTGSQFDGPVTEQRVVDESELLLLSVHDIDRVVQHDIGNPGRTGCHENRHAWLM
jgi:hypothetical protein